MNKITEIAKMISWLALAVFLTIAAYDKIMAHTTSTIAQLEKQVNYEY